MGQTLATGRWIFWVAAAAVFLVLLWLLNDILLPFVVGMVVAYFLDPVVARLQRARMSRAMATTLVTIVAVLFSIGVVMAILPPLFGQIQSLDTSGVAPLTTTANIESSPERADVAVIPADPIARRTELLANAPASEMGFFVVPKIVE